MQGKNFKIVLQMNRLRDFEKVVKYSTAVRYCNRSTPLAEFISIQVNLYFRVVSFKKFAMTIFLWVLCIYGYFQVCQIRNIRLKLILKQGNNLPDMHAYVHSHVNIKLYVYIYVKIHCRCQEIFLLLWHVKDTEICCWLFTKFLVDF